MQHDCVITLTTDFGYRDPFAGIMKGVILSINPFVHIIDITHDIGPQNILEAALAIEMSFNSFPHKTIHVVVVDPGVGSSRRHIIVTTGKYFFVGPDNGVFSLIYQSPRENLAVVHITSEHYFLSQKSSTFHGRDIYAPVAAWLSRDIDVSKFGEVITDYVKIPLPVPTLQAQNILEGEVVYIDSFGNAITNIKTHHMNNLYGSNLVDHPAVLFKGNAVPFKHYYSEAEATGLYSLINAFGSLELFVYKGNASSDFAIRIGDKVSVVVN
jgi:S-adenosylmethionine hydrolase